MKKRISPVFRNACLPLGGMLLSIQAFASVIALGPDAFPTGSPVLTFDGFSDGTDVNGLTYNGVRFTYEIASTALNDGVVTFDASHNIPANHVTLPAVVSSSNSDGTLRLALPMPAIVFGYGYVINPLAIFGSMNPPATTISLFRGATPVGSLSYTAAPDPSVFGGFAGIESTIPFDTVALTFSSAPNPTEFFSVDNIQFDTAPSVPEPSTVLLLVAAFCCASAAKFCIAARRAIHLKCVLRERRRAY